MCNPRRVMVHLNRAVEEAWRTTVEQTARAEGAVRETARVTADIPLDAEMGDLPLVMLERLVRGDVPDFPAWAAAADGAFRRDLGDVTLVYRPGTRQLVVEARLAETVGVDATAAAEAAGFSVGEVAVEAVGHYYDDGWGGRTEDAAKNDAAADGEAKLAAAVEAFHRQQHAEALTAAEGRAKAEAERLAAEALDRARAEMRRALRARLQAVLAAAQDRVNHTMNRLVGEAYRLALIRLAQQNGGRVVADERTGSVMTLEVEVP